MEMISHLKYWDCFNVLSVRTLKLFLPYTPRSSSNKGIWNNLKRKLEYRF